MKSNYEETDKKRTWETSDISFKINHRTNLIKKRKKIIKINNSSFSFLVNSKKDVQVEKKVNKVNKKFQIHQIISNLILRSGSKFISKRNFQEKLFYPSKKYQIQERTSLNYKINKIANFEKIFNQNHHKNGFNIKSAITKDFSPKIKNIKYKETFQNPKIQKVNKMDKINKLINILQIKKNLSNSQTTNFQTQIPSPYNKVPSSYNKPSDELFFPSELNHIKNIVVQYKPKVKSDLPTCKCKSRTHCLRMKCSCFKKLAYCSSECKCMNCMNTEKYKKTRNILIKTQKIINKNSFSTGNVNESIINVKNVKINKFGCNCKKGQCDNKYCGCNILSAKCSSLCRCINCVNEKLILNQEEQKKFFFKKKRKKDRIIIDYETKKIILAKYKNKKNI